MHKKNLIFVSCRERKVWLGVGRIPPKNKKILNGPSWTCSVKFTLFLQSKWQENPRFKILKIEH